MKSGFAIGILVVFAGIPAYVYGQSAYISGQDSSRNPITVAVPFLSFAPDSRGSAMGDAGVSTSPDVYSAHWNNAKLAFIETDMGFSYSYSPWLGKIVDDMSLNYVTFYKKIDRLQTFGASMRYFDLGEIALTDGTGAPLGIENPREAAFDATYSRKLTDYSGVGVTGRFIWSNISGNITGATGVKAGTSIAVDIGYYFNRPIVFSGRDSELSLGAFISNFGRKITYTTDANENFIPGNLRWGSSFKTNIDPYNSITVILEFNKLIVPTPPIYETDEDGNIVIDQSTQKPVILRGEDPNRPLLSGTFGSFTDAPGGFEEELKEVMISAGAEYWYQDVFSIRMGYFNESLMKGNRKYFTAGLGFRYQVVDINFSYLVPQQDNNPLAETLRVSLAFNLEKTENEDVPVLN